MRKRIRLTYLLVVTIIYAVTFVRTPSSLITGPTYVEGPITQDTVWTLTDSPFVVSKDITVYPDVTLTIEPGVEVRFGGDFSLTVEGYLYACGTENNTITFTSNKDQPEEGDWNTVELRGSEQSILECCVVQYAENGITILNSHAEVKNSQIANSSQNGIHIMNSRAEVKNILIVNCSQNGIHITGDNQATIQNNRISSNANGIFLNTTTGVSITENILMLNTQSGIYLDGDDYRNVVILNNILSANQKGFYISGNASTYITRNSISYNTVGIFYGGGGDHVAYYNDIYGNEYGMDLSSNATVNAEYNYWGHETGPYHISLNPAGRGNPVAGNGVNLDFIFFLTQPISYINTRPTATLLTDKTIVAPNHVVTFIATASNDDGCVDKYLFNFGDGNSSGWTTLSIFTHRYPSAGTYHASLTVMDDFGVESTNVAKATIDAKDLNPLDISLTANHYRVSCGEEVSVTAHVTYEISPVETASVTLFSVTDGDFTASSSSTNSTGHVTTTIIAPNVTRKTHVRLTATASKSNYADGSDYVYLLVLPPLSVEVIANPSSIESEAISEVTVDVTYNGQLVADASVTIWSDGWGNFSAISGKTDSNGSCTFVFTAPLTTTELSVTITAIAVKAGYADGQGQTEITIIPKTLLVELRADPKTLHSEEMSFINVYVTYNSTPISDVNVTMSSTHGTFFPETGITDLNGSASFTFTAPQAITQQNVTIMATATKTSYAEGEGQAGITVSPGTLDVQVTVSPATVKSRDVSTVIVHVTSDAKPIAAANVTVSSDGGGIFSPIEKTTDSNGDATFVFTAPQTTTELSITITATTTKTGYIDGESQTIITISPEPGVGLPLIPILIAAVVIIVVAILVLLINLKVISISWK